MTYSPSTWIAWRDAWERETKLPKVSLGLQHYANKDGSYTGGGGYHAGNDLLAIAGRLNTDYSKRQSDRDRPGSDGSSASDIGWFDVALIRTDGSVRRVTLIDWNVWLIAQLNADAPDTRWIREVIYTLDRKTVKRWDRLKQSTTGDDSHLTHTHVSGFRDEENTPKAPLAERFWTEMRGGGSMASSNEERLQWMAHSFELMTPTVEGGPVKGRVFQHAVMVRQIRDNQMLILANQSADEARDRAILAVLKSIADDADVATILNEVRAAASDVKTEILERLAADAEELDNETREAADKAPSE